MENNTENNTGSGAGSKWIKGALIAAVIVAALIALTAGGILVYRNVIVPKNERSRADSLLEEGRYIEAVEAYRKLGLPEQVTEAYRRGGAAYEAAGDLESAMDMYRDAGDDEKALELRYQWAGQLEESDPDAACMQYKKCGDYLDSAERIAVVYAGAGDAALAKGAYDEALSYYGLAGNAEGALKAHYAKAVSLETAGSLADAAEEYGLCAGYQDADERLDRIMNDAGNAYGESAMKLLEKGDAIGAVKNFVLAGDYDKAFRVYGEMGCAIYGGTSHTLLLNANGELFIAGRRGEEDLTSPVKLMEGVKSAAAGDRYSLIVTKDNVLYATGELSRCGIGQDTDDVVRVRANVACADAMGSRAVLVLDDGSLVSYEAGEEKTFALESPVTAAACGSYHTLALTDDGALYGWGSNISGQLGEGVDGSANEPVMIFDNVSGMDAGSLFSVAWTPAGTLYAWGGNANGQLGNDTTDDSAAPVKVLINVRKAVCGAGHVAALTSDGLVYTWGADSKGQLGFGIDQDIGIPIPVFSGAIDMGAGLRHTLIVLSDGTIVAFGEGKNGQLVTGRCDGVLIPETLTVRITDCDRALTVDFGSETPDEAEETGAAPEQTEETANETQTAPEQAEGAANETPAAPAQTEEKTGEP